MEQFQMLLGAVAAGFIVPFTQWLKTKISDLPFVFFLITNGLAVGFGFLFNELFKLGLATDMVVYVSLGIIGTAAQGAHALYKTKIKRGK